MSKHVTVAVTQMRRLGRFQTAAYDKAGKYVTRWWGPGIRDSDPDRWFRLEEAWKRDHPQPLRLFKAVNKNLASPFTVMIGSATQGVKVGSYEHRGQAWAAVSVVENGKEKELYRVKLGAEEGTTPDQDGGDETTDNASASGDG